MSKAQAARAGAWSTIETVLRQGILFVIAVILARLLTPEDFGVIAILSFFTSLALVLVQAGLTTVLIQRQETSHGQESTLFWLNLGASAVLATVIVLISFPVARFYDQPVLQPLMMLAGAQVVLGALGAVQSALLTRALRFDQLAKAGLFSSILSGAAALGAAYAGAGVWALAIQTTVMVALNSLALWFCSSWRPAFHFRLKSVRALLGFGVWLSMSSVLEVLFSQGSSLLVGKLYGVRDLGLYNRAASTQQLPSTILSSIIARVALPLFSSRAEDKEGMRRGVRMAIDVTMLINVPILLGLALTAPMVMEVLFGTPWVKAAPILSILAIGGLFFPMHVINLQALLAQGQSKRFFQLEIGKKLVGLACVLAGSLFGVIGLAWSQLLFAFIALLINVAPTKRSLGYGLLAQLRDLAGIALSAAAMAGVVATATMFLDLSALAELPLVVTLGAATYFGVGFGLKLRSFTDALELARQLRNNHRPQKPVVS
jgi:O-antigen/teichoic acid export membrane protein